MPSDIVEQASPLPPSVSDPTAKAASSDSTFSRTACGECQRRKQKCDRGWPCNHCQKRKVAEKCNYRGKISITKSSTQSSVNYQASETPEVATNKRRYLSYENPSRGYEVESLEDDSDSADNERDRECLENLGYSASHHFVLLTKSDDELDRTKKKRGRKPAYRLGPPQNYMDPSSCPQLQRAIEVLPPRPYTDALIQNFLQNVNFHYYIIYPHGFIDEYLAWWNDRADNRPLGLQWTCLLMMVCACSTQYTDEELQQKLENDLSETTQTLTERYHSAARELHNVIPISNSHLFNVQQLLHSCYWYKSEVRFAECWHALGSAIREAQELGIHHEASSDDMPEFEREMRRRIWCVLNTWDWQISALLSRPMLINRADCDVKLPSLSLEGYLPSPLQCMKLQSGLIERLACRFGLPKNVVEPSDIKEYINMLEVWMETFPSVFDLKEPDKSQDTNRPWIKLHRHYLHTMSYSMALDPIRAYLTTKSSKDSAPEVLSIRDSGIDYALKLIGALYGFFDHVWPRDAKFHFVIFAIFDTASILCSAIIHNMDKTIPRETEVLDAIENAASMLRRLQEMLPSARVSYNLLVRFWKKARKLSTRGQAASEGGKHQRKRVKVAKLLPTSSHESIGTSTADDDILGQMDHIPAANQPVEFVKGVGSSSHLHPVAHSMTSNDRQPPADSISDSSHLSGSASKPFFSSSSSRIDAPELPTSLSIHESHSTVPVPGFASRQPIDSATMTTVSGTQLNGLSSNTNWSAVHFNGTYVGYAFPDNQLHGPQLASTAVARQYHEGALIQDPSTMQSIDNGSIQPVTGEYVEGGDDINFDLGSIMENEASGLAQLWDWRGLDLEFLPSAHPEPEHRDFRTPSFKGDIVP